MMETPNYFLFVEHPHVYTLGKSGDENNMLISTETLEKINASYVKTNRGGDITYHGYGQIVGYPVLDLEIFFARSSKLPISPTQKRISGVFPSVEYSAIVLILKSM